MIELTKEEKSVLCETLFYVRTHWNAFDAVADYLDLNEEHLKKILSRGVKFFTELDPKGEDREVE